MLQSLGQQNREKRFFAEKLFRSRVLFGLTVGKSKKSDDFWGSLLRELDLPDEETVSEKTSLTASFKVLIGLKAQVTDGASVKFNGATKKEILRTMRERDMTLIVDDFHYLSSKLQTEVVRSLKSEVFDGLQVVFIAVPHRALDAISAEPEMEGRYSHINIPEWNVSDLGEISRVGFPKLGMSVDAETIADFCAESLGSPLLMQRFCGRLCLNYSVEKTVKPDRDFVSTIEVRKGIYRKVAEQFGFPTFEKLAKGPQSRSKRNPRRLRDGSGSLDIYQAILVAVGNTGPKPKLHYDKIREALQKLLRDYDVPQKHEVSNALGQMESIARKKLKGEPVLEWSDDFLYLTNPFLMFYMRWSDTEEISKV